MHRMVRTTDRGRNDFTSRTLHKLSVCLPVRLSQHTLPTIPITITPTNLHRSLFSAASQPASQRAYLKSLTLLQFQFHIRIRIYIHRHIHIHIHIHIHTTHPPPTIPYLDMTAGVMCIETKPGTERALLYLLTPLPCTHYRIREMG